MKAKPSPLLVSRPYPPRAVTLLGAADVFMPAPDFSRWIRAAYLDEKGPLYYSGHAHLLDAKLGVLWTNTENRRQMRRIVGQAELVKNAGARAGVWQRVRAEQQLENWFGEVPDFLLTFDALYAEQVDHGTFAALVDHELCHCAQELDEFGAGKHDRMGRPKFAMRGHDVEEFVSVVSRFGIEAAGPKAVDFVVAAAGKPLVMPAKLAEACGTCLRLAA